MDCCVPSQIIILYTFQENQHLRPDSEDVGKTLIAFRDNSELKRKSPVPSGSERGPHPVQLGKVLGAFSVTLVVFHEEGIFTPYIYEWDLGSPSRRNPVKEHVSGHLYRMSIPCRLEYTSDVACLSRLSTNGCLCLEGT